MAVVKSVSLSQQDAAWLAENDLSPSGMLQQAILEAKKRLDSEDPTVSWETKNKILAKRLTLAYDFINQRGLFDAFLEFKAKGE